MLRPQYVTETQTLIRIARHVDCRFIWTKHALAAVNDEGLTTGDVEFALTRCHVVLQEFKKDRLWRAIGNDIDGVKIEMVVSVYEEEITIKIITVF
jgi:hypothetical protein